MSQLTITPILIEQDIDRHSYLLSYEEFLDEFGV